jgi:uncharacterized protein (DUF697 family)
MASKTGEQAAIEENREAAVPSAAADLSMKAELIIKNHMMATGAASLVPVPLADMAAITAVQLRMIKSLAELYGKSFSEAPVRNTISALAGGVFGYSAGVTTAVSLAKFIPGAGMLFGMMTMPVVAGSTTYAIGHVFKRHFEEGGSIVNVSVDNMRGYFKEQLEAGKKVAKSAKSQIHKFTAPAEQPA